MSQKIMLCFNDTNISVSKRYYKTYLHLKYNVIMYILHTFAMFKIIIAFSKFILSEILVRYFLKN